MRELSLERAAVYSLGLHILCFIFLSVAVQRPRPDQQTIYTVRIITPDVKSVSVTAPGKEAAGAEGDKQGKAAESTQQRQKAPPPKKDPSAATYEEEQKAQKKKAAETAAQQAMAIRQAREAQEKRAREQREQELKAQQEAQEYKARRLQEIETRRRLESIRDTASRKGGTSSKVLSGPERSSILNDYAKRIEAEIKKNWIFTEIEAKRLLTEIRITVQADGLLRIEQVTRPSGNRAFDNSTIKAVRKTAQVEPPPFGEDMEIVLGFSPYEQ